MRIVRLLALMLVSTIALMAETVYLTAKGKTYHKAESCMALSRAKVKFTAERADAERHGLSACSICYRAKLQKKAGNESWAVAPKGGK